MKRLLIYLYPYAWRQRYKDEFLAVLDHHPVTLCGVFDIVMGAIDARRYFCSQGMGRRVMGVSSQWSTWRAILLLSIGVVFLLRSVLQSVFVIVYVDVIAILSLFFLCSGLAVAYRIRKQAQNV